MQKSYAEVKESGNMYKVYNEYNAERREREIRREGEIGTNGKAHRKSVNQRKVQQKEQ